LLALLLELVAAFAAVGCSSSAPTRAGSAGAAMDANTAPPPFVFAQHVAAGTDVYSCAYLVPSSTDVFLVGASHVATAGTHHVLVFRTDLTSIPDGGGAPVDCYAGPSSPMRHMRGEVYGSQVRTASFGFPSGVGLPLHGGEVLLVQVHFLNAGASDIDASVRLALTTTTEGIATRAGVFFFDDPFIDIPAGALSQATMRCLVPNDVTIVSASSHDHARAQSVAAFLDPPGGAPATLPFYSALDAANPLPLQATVPVPAGTRVRFTCKYQNVSGTGEILQGLDYQADEMCVLSGAYFPAVDAQAESCALAPDDFGTGQGTCSQALACVNACPAGSGPPADLGLSSTPDVDPCWQRCVVASCGDASALLFALERCANKNCSTECAAPASDACAACQTAQCPAQSSACAGDACGG
jgi:Copper type II ascorbate-dependent monooxygenase, C-terminal domain